MKTKVEQFIEIVDIATPFAFLIIAVLNDAAIGTGIGGIMVIAHVAKYAFKWLSK